ncbi:ABC transporter permease [Aquibacillus salsiterrae]|uniref:Autoinducer 2 import system permease protein LsrD n=1 Tax=Aquibacillus salsiterrae TaxID=2950439 RepID=A0A9X3WCV4_9BACI|nr:ABC transporter permease [Aquibacillus salsiterrae]MDC3417515.1 ABC transporter permease [Aquibacillus salsiterrae]
MSTRIVSNIQKFTWKRFFLQWEWMLIALLVIIFTINSNISPYFLNYTSITDATMTFLDKAFIVFPMVMIMIMREIDISVGSTAALSSIVMATLYNAGVPMVIAIVACLLVGALCGFFNGYLLVKYRELSAVIVTLSTMILYRGIAYMILEDRSAGDFPDWFSYFGWGYVGGIPFILCLFVVLAIGFVLLLQKTTIGRRIYAVGSNPKASRFSGVKVDKIKLLVFTLAGLMAAITAIFLTSRMGSTRPNVANMYELDVIAMVALGGISTVGGKGKMLGAVLAVFVIGYLQFGLGLINIPAQMLLIVIGILLIVSVTVTNFRVTRKAPQRKAKKNQAKKVS